MKQEHDKRKISPARGQQELCNNLQFPASRQHRFKAPTTEFHGCWYTAPQTAARKSPLSRVSIHRHSGKPAVVDDAHIVWRCGVNEATRRKRRTTCQVVPPTKLGIAAVCAVSDTVKTGGLFFKGFFVFLWDFFLFFVLATGKR